MAAGRPPIIKTADELKRRIDEYFEACEAAERMPTVPGLVYSLGYADRASYLDLKNRNQTFSRIINNTNLRFEDAHIRFGRSMDMFCLKANHGYREKTELELSGAVAQMTHEEWLDSLS